jgi:hypothetical protein
MGKEAGNRPKRKIATLVERPVATQRRPFIIDSYP